MRASVPASERDGTASGRYARAVISVVVPLRDEELTIALLYDEVRSALEPLGREWEIVYVDDGSTDGSLELGRSLGDPRVFVWSDGKTKGLAARLNECIARARGQFIARMDAYDISYPDRLRRQVEYLQAHVDVDVVGCCMLICEEDGTPIGKRTAPVDHAAITANPALGFGLAHPTWMARAAWYRSSGLSPRVNSASVQPAAWPALAIASTSSGDR